LRLFDEIERTETRPRKEREPTFDYWNTSARKAVGLLRSIIQEWFGSYPADAQKDLWARFRSPIDSQHQSAFWELYLHELFLGMGYALEVHPTIAGTANRPDYLVTAGREPVFYLEATVAGLPSQENAGAEARLREVFDLVNKLENPDFYLEVEHTGLPNTPPPVRGLRKDLEKWLKSLDVDPIRGAWRDGAFDKLPSLRRSHNGLTLTFRPIPKSRSAQGERAIAIAAGDAHLLTADEDIRASAESKAGKYGELTLPIVIAVNYAGDHCDDFDISNALFGRETLKVAKRSDGSYDWGPGRRLPDGFWFGKNGPRNLNVSAILIANDVNAYSAGTTTPQLIRNPYLDKMLALPFYLLPQLVPDQATRTMKRIEGKEAKEFLRLPSTWPPPPD
jgi:hypothetical protein